MHGYDKNWVKCLELPWASAAKAPGPTRVINPGPDWALDSRGSLIAHKYPRAAGLKDAVCWFWLTAGQSESTSGRRRYQRWGLHRMSVFEPPSICLDKRNLMSSMCDPSAHHWTLFWVYSPPFFHKTQKTNGCGGNRNTSHLSSNTFNYSVDVLKWSTICNLCRTAFEVAW